MSNTAPGTRVAERYELVSPLGEGGMGVVWRARDTRLGRSVAVKLLSAASVGTDLARVRLIREARAAAALEHDSIIRVYDVGEMPDGGAFLVMELIRGKTLRDELDKGGPLPPRRALRIVASAARALHFAHASGVVHRDVKPDNIMLREGDRVIVVDFGVAKPVSTEIVANAETLAGVTNTALTGAGVIIGTPAYLSPEQACGPDVGAASDQFSLGVTAYETLTGHRPWTGKTVVEVIASILRDEPKSLREVAPEITPEVEAAVRRALRKEPRDRYPDLGAFADALDEAAKTLPEEDAAPVSITGPAPAKTQAGAVSSTGGQSTTAPVPRKSRAGLVLGLAAVLAIAFGVVATRRNVDRSVGAASAEVRAIACPPFEVAGLDAPWLGGAAAALACDRVQLARGGGDRETVTPADLLGAPREIAPAFPAQLLDKPDGRASALERARGGDRWLDGKVEKRGDAFVVSIVLRRGHAEAKDDPRGEGQAVELFEAVRDALRPVLASAPPPSKEGERNLADWLDVTSVGDAQALLDVRTAILIEDPVVTKHVCTAIETRTTLRPRVTYLARSMCRKRLRTGPLTEPPPAVDASTPGALITTSLAQGTAGGPDAVKARAERLEKLRDQTDDLEGKARLAAAAAELYNLVGDPRTRDLARSAIRSSPKAVDWRTSAWHRSAFTSTGDGSAAAALAAWQPWEPVAQSVWIVRSGAPANDGKAMMDAAGRSYLLSRRGPYAIAYGTVLLDRGDVEAARSVAELAQDPLLDVDIMLADAHYAAVLEKVPKLIAALPASDENAALAFGLAYRGIRASAILERSPDYVDDVVQRFVLSEPPHIVDGVSPTLSLLNACLLAPRAIGTKCVGRIEALWHEGKLPTIFGTLETILAGAIRFVADDYPGAVRSWRTLLRSAGWIQGPLREPVAIAFDRAGELDLADEADAAVVALADLPRTADLAWVRAAKRAEKRGDFAQAKKLARLVVDKWRFADDRVPATDEMKRLLAKLPP